MRYKHTRLLLLERISKASRSLLPPLRLSDFRYPHLALKRDNRIKNVARGLLRKAYDGLKMKSVLVNACETYVAKN